jgi:hypothetical protein
VPTSGGIAQARQRLGCEPLKGLFAEVAVPVAEDPTRGAFLGPWRLMAIGGFEWDAPDRPENVALFGFCGAGTDDAERPAFPNVRVVTPVGLDYLIWLGCSSPSCGGAAGSIAGIGAAFRGSGRVWRRNTHLARRPPRHQPAGGIPPECRALIRSGKGLG